MTNALSLRRGKKLFTIGVVVATIVWSIGLTAFVPVAQGATSGDLIKASGAAVYYYGADGKRYVFPNEPTYKTWYADFSTVKIVTDSELAAIPIGGNVTYRPGVKMVKITTDPKVYAVSKGGVLKHVTTEAIATALYGANWNQMINDVADSFFVNYTVGTPINVASEYTPATETAGTTSINTDKSLNGGTTPVAGDLTVSLNPSSPAGTSVPFNSADVVFFKMDLNGSGTVSQIRVTRSGLSSDSDLAEIKLFDGTTQIGTGQTLNASHQAVFNVNVAVNGTKTITVAADIAPTGTANASDELVLSVESASDITSTASVGGSFPVRSKTMTVSSVTIGTATLALGAQHPSSDTNVNADAVDFRFTQVRITAGSTEGLRVKQITAVRNGTASDSDVQNIKLVDDKTGTTLGTVPSLTSGRATFNLDVPLGKGENRDFSIMASITGSGSGRTLSFDLHDGTDFLIRVVGQQYGFGINPTNSNFCTDNCQTQTIAQGTLTVDKSSLSPATGNIPQGGSDVVLGAFNYRVTGEPVRISRMLLTLIPASGGSTEDLTNVAFYMYDANQPDGLGTLLAGPQDGSTAAANTNQTLTFTDSLTLPVGDNTIMVAANVSNSSVAAETHQVRIDAPSTNFTVRGDQSNQTITSGTAVSVSANVMTVQAAALTVTTAATPIVGNVVAGVQNFRIMTLNLDATAGGEDVKITAVTVTDTLGATATASDIQNLELWGDPDNTDSNNQYVRLDTTNNTSTGAATVTFTFKSPIKVSKTKVSTLDLLVDISSGATIGGTETHAFNVAAAGNVSATGYTTSNTAAVTVNGAGQAQTLVASGALQVERAGDRPNAAQLVAGSTDVPVMKYKLTATSENVDVTTIPLFVSGTATGSDVMRVKLWVDGVQVGSTSGYPLSSTNTASAVLNSGTLVVQKDQSRYVTLTVDLQVKEALTSARTIIAGLGDSDGNATEWGGAGNYNITATGVASGTALTKANIDDVGDGSGSVYGGNTMTAYDGVLTVSLNSASPSGTQTAGSGKEVIRFDLTATGDEITINDIEFTVGGTATITGTGDLVLESVDGSTDYVKWVTGDCATVCLLTSTTPDTGDDGTDDAGSAFGSSAATQSLIIGAGMTRTVKLTGDTTGATTNDTLQVSISDSADESTETETSGIAWSSGSNAEAVDSLQTKNLPVYGNGLSY